jgi:hypothetical protein
MLLWAKGDQVATCSEISFQQESSAPVLNGIYEAGIMLLGTSRSEIYSESVLMCCVLLVVLMEGNGVWRRYDARGQGRLR